MGFWLVPKSVTLTDLDWRNADIFLLFCCVCGLMWTCVFVGGLMVCRLCKYLMMTRHVTLLLLVHWCATKRDSSREDSVWLVPVVQHLRWGLVDYLLSIIETCLVNSVRPIPVSCISSLSVAIFYPILLLFMLVTHWKKTENAEKDDDCLSVEKADDCQWRRMTIVSEGRWWLSAKKDDDCLWRRMTIVSEGRWWLSTKKDDDCLWGRMTIICGEGWWLLMMFAAELKSSSLCYVVLIKQPSPKL